MTYRKNLLFGSILAAAALYGTSASAQATRTWVSGVGDDANPCSRTAPCKTFAGAISKTAAGGEINCLDPGGFGGVTITKALTILCDYTEGGVLTAGAGVNGIVVNAPATSDVFLSGLDLHGAGNAQNGLRILAGRSVHFQNGRISYYQASNGQGISFQPSGNTMLSVTNSTISNNGNGATGGGMLIQPTGVAGQGRVELRNVRFQNNANNNLHLNTTGNTGPGISLNIEDSQFTGSTFGVNLLVPVGTTNVGVMIVGSNMSHNQGGIAANGGTLTVRVGQSTITANSANVANAGGVLISNGAQVLSYGDNRLDGNFNNGGLNNGAFTGAIIPTR